MQSVSPELLTDDGLEGRAAELERRVAREWLRYALIEGLLIGVPFIVVLWASVAMDASKGTIVTLAGVGTIIWVAFSLYRVLARIQPLRRELESLRRGAAR